MTATLERQNQRVRRFDPKRWDAARIARYVALGLLFGLIAWVNAVNLSSFPLSFDDEGTYVAQAWALLTNGELSHYPYWYDHPPGGWIVIAAWAFLTDGFARTASAVALGREVALIAAMASTVLLYILCRRIGMRWGFAALAVALFGLSPLATEFHRMVFLDNLVTPWLLATFVLMRGKRSLLAYSGAGVCFAFAVLTKITAGMFLPLILWELWRTTYPQNRRYAIVLMLGNAILVGFLWPLMALMRGEFLPSPDNTSIIEGLIYQLGGRDGDNLVSVLNAWTTTDVWFIYAGLLAVIPALFFRHLRLYALIIPLHVAVLLRGGYVPLPFIIQVLPYMALVIAGVLDASYNVAISSRLAHWRSPTKLLRAGAAISLLAGFFVFLAPPMARDWPGTLHQMQTHDAQRGYENAVPWIMENLDPEANILVENQIWIDVVRAGRPEASTIWHFKLGLDPGVADMFPDGYLNFDYVVETRAMRDAASESPGIPEALAESYPVQRFGSGNDMVQVRRILNPDALATVEGLAEHYGEPVELELFGEVEESVVGETDVQDLPTPDEGGVLASWDDRHWLVDIEHGVRFPVYPTDASSEERLAEEQSFEARGAESWDEAEELALQDALAEEE